MPDSRSREPGRESPTYNGAVDGDTFVAPLNVKTTLNVKTAKCEKNNNR